MISFDQGTQSHFLLGRFTRHLKRHVTRSQMMSLLKVLGDLSTRKTKRGRVSSRVLGLCKRSLLRRDKTATFTIARKRNIMNFVDIFPVVYNGDTKTNCVGYIHMKVWSLTGKKPNKMKLNYFHDLLKVLIERGYFGTDSLVEIFVNDNLETCHISYHQLNPSRLVPASVLPQKRCTRARLRTRSDDDDDGKKVIALVPACKAETDSCAECNVDVDVCKNKELHDQITVDLYMKSLNTLGTILSSICYNTQMNVSRSCSEKISEESKETTFKFPQFQKDAICRKLTEDPARSRNLIDYMILHFYASYFFLKYRALTSTFASEFYELEDATRVKKTINVDKKLEQQFYGAPPVCETRRVDYINAALYCKSVRRFHKPSPIFLNQALFSKPPNDKTKHIPDYRSALHAIIINKMNSSIVRGAEVVSLLEKYCTHPLTVLMSSLRYAEITCQFSNYVTFLSTLYDFQNGFWASYMSTIIQTDEDGVPCSITTASNPDNGLDFFQSRLTEYCRDLLQQNDNVEFDTCVDKIFSKMVVFSKHYNKLLTTGSQNPIRYCKTRSRFEDLVTVNCCLGICIPAYTIRSRVLTEGCKESMTKQLDCGGQYKLLTQYTDLCHEDCAKPDNEAELAEDIEVVMDNVTETMNEEKAQPTQPPPPPETPRPVHQRYHSRKMGPDYYGNDDSDYYAPRKYQPQHRGEERMHNGNMRHYGEMEGPEHTHKLSNRQILYSNLDNSKVKQRNRNLYVKDFLHFFNRKRIKRSLDELTSAKKQNKVALAPIGGSIILLCPISQHRLDYKLPQTFHWISSSGDIIPSGNRSVFRYLYHSFNELQITQVKDTDEGIFQCITNLPNGQLVTGSIFLEVQYCQRRPCFNGGRCEEVKWNARTKYKFLCHCIMDYAGALCQLHIVEEQQKFISAFLLFFLPLPLVVIFITLWYLNHEKTTENDDEFQYEMHRFNDTENALTSPRTVSKSISDNYEAVQNFLDSMWDDLRAWQNQIAFYIQTEFFSFNSKFSFIIPRLISQTVHITPRTVNRKRPSMGSRSASSHRHHHRRSKFGRTSKSTHRQNIRGYSVQHSLPYGLPTGYTRSRRYLRSNGKRGILTVHSVAAVNTTNRNVNRPDTTPINYEIPELTIQQHLKQMMSINNSNHFGNGKPIGYISATFVKPAGKEHDKEEENQSDGNSENFEEFETDLSLIHQHFTQSKSDMEDDMNDDFETIIASDYRSHIERFLRDHLYHRHHLNDQVFHFQKFGDYDHSLALDSYLAKKRTHRISHHRHTRDVQRHHVPRAVLKGHHMIKKKGIMLKKKKFNGDPVVFGNCNSHIRDSFNLVKKKGHSKRDGKQTNIMNFVELFPVTYISEHTRVNGIGYVHMRIWAGNVLQFDKKTLDKLHETLKEFIHAGFFGSDCKVDMYVNDQLQACAIHREQLKPSRLLPKENLPVVQCDGERIRLRKADSPSSRDLPFTPAILPHCNPNYANAATMTVDDDVDENKELHHFMTNKLFEKSQRQINVMLKAICTDEHVGHCNDKEYQFHDKVKRSTMKKRKIAVCRHFYGLDVDTSAATVHYMILHFFASYYFLMYRALMSSFRNEFLNLDNPFSDNMGNQAPLGTEQYPRHDDTSNDHLDTTIYCQSFRKYQDYNPITVNHPEFFRKSAEILGHPLGTKNSLHVLIMKMLNTKNVSGIYIVELLGNYCNHPYTTYIHAVKFLPVSCKFVNYANYLSNLYDIQNAFWSSYFRTALYHCTGKAMKMYGICDNEMFSKQMVTFELQLLSECNKLLRRPDNEQAIMKMNCKQLVFDKMILFSNMYNEKLTSGRQDSDYSLLRINKFDDLITVHCCLGICLPAYVVRSRYVKERLGGVSMNIISCGGPYKLLTAFTNLTVIDDIAAPDDYNLLMTNIHNLNTAPEDARAPEETPIVVEADVEPVNTYQEVVYQPEAVEQRTVTIPHHHNPFFDSDSNRHYANVDYDRSAKQRKRHNYLRTVKRTDHRVPYSMNRQRNYHQHVRSPWYNKQHFAQRLRYRRSPITGLVARSRLVVAQIGGSAILLCPITQHKLDHTLPKPFYWISPNGDILSSGKRSIFRYLYHSFNQLQITQVKDTDEGIFQCITTLPNGQLVTGSIFLEVQYCQGRPCLNGGRCEEVKWNARTKYKFICHCLANFAGALCQFHIVEEQQRFVSAFLLFFLPLPLVVIFITLWYLNHEKNTDCDEELEYEIHRLHNLQSSLANQRAISKSIFDNYGAVQNFLDSMWDDIRAWQNQFAFYIQAEFDALHMRFMTIGPSHVNSPVMRYRTPSVPHRSSLKRHTTPKSHRRMSSSRRHRHRRSKSGRTVFPMSRVKSTTTRGSRMNTSRGRSRFRNSSRSRSSRIGMQSGITQKRANSVWNSSNNNEDMNFNNNISSIDDEYLNFGTPDKPVGRVEATYPNNKDTVPFTPENGIEPTGNVAAGYERSLDDQLVNRNNMNNNKNPAQEQKEMKRQRKLDRKKHREKREKRHGTKSRTPKDKGNEPSEQPNANIWHSVANSVNGQEPSQPEQTPENRLTQSDQRSVPTQQQQPPPLPLSQLLPQPPQQQLQSQTHSRPAQLLAPEQQPPHQHEQPQQWQIQEPQQPLLPMPQPQLLNLHHHHQQQQKQQPIQLKHYNQQQQQLSHQHPGYHHHHQHPQQQQQSHSLEKQEIPSAVQRPIKPRQMLLPIKLNIIPDPNGQEKKKEPEDCQLDNKVKIPRKLNRIKNEKGFVTKGMVQHLKTNPVNNNNNNEMNFNNYELKNDQ
ncbi:hypothetical protein SNEBB_000269 [Seison nebaliae]|nr:hypothetical protein SNEBB_000269 [Seison nebaliae]